MDTLFLILATAVLLFVISRAVARLAAREDAVLGAVKRRNDLEDTLGKITSTLKLFRADLDATKLAPGRTRYTLYYCGYVYGMAQAIARSNETEFSLQVKVPILREFARLCGSGAEDYKEGERLLASVLDSEEARAGQIAGAQDASDALDPAFRGPFWTKLDRFFR